MATKLKRVSVAIDDETSSILEELANKENKTVSEIIREAIVLYSKLGDGEENRIDINKIKAYDELLSGREHIILDLEVWIAVLDELNEKASEEFWKIVGEIGRAHGIQFKIKGVNNIHDVLKYLELENLFRVKVGEGYFTLILTSRNGQKFVRIFLENVFKAMGIKVELIEGLRKITIIDKSRAAKKNSVIQTA